MGPVCGEFDSRRVWGPKPRYPNVLAEKPRRTDLMVVAGPCSVENEAQIEAVVDALRREESVKYARGGLYRAGTYPPEREYGLRKDLAAKWSRACRKAGLRTIVEVLDLRQVDWLDGHADAFQVGARHMQDYALLRELSRCGKHVALKRSPGATLDEFLGAAEYLCRGSCSPILVERGSSSHMNHVRWDLSVSTIAAVKGMTGLPVLVDASHGSGRRDLVFPLTMAGLAAGADGFMVEVHPFPEKSLSDADQAYPLYGLSDMILSARELKSAMR